LKVLVDHVRFATNGGKIKPLLTVFAARNAGIRGIRIWNSQLIRYAGYRQSDGSILGDPLNTDLTDAIFGLGWKGAQRTPLMFSRLSFRCRTRLLKCLSCRMTQSWRYPSAIRTLIGFVDLDLRWHALPAISDIRLEVGGVSYTAAPFQWLVHCH